MRHRITLPIALLLVVTAAGSAQSVSVGALKDSSWVSYLLVHPLHEIHATSREVKFTAVLDTAARRLSGLTAAVDVLSFDSGNSNRDSHAGEVVDAISYPMVAFTSTRVIAHGDSIAVAGTLNFHGVTKPVTAEGTAVWSGRELSVQGGFNISLTEFQIDRPSLLMVPVQDTLRFTVHAVFPLGR